MDISKKLLIDVEKDNNVKGYEIISIDGYEIEYVISGKMIIAIPKNERDYKIYKLLEENCDVIFCTTWKMDEFPFYPVPTLTIFAYDSKGNRFGTIGGIGDIESDDYPVGYIDQEGMYGKISSSLKEFLELITFYPYWREIVKYERIGVAYDMDDMELKQIKDTSQYFACQTEIAETFKISKNLQSIESLLSNIRSIPGFVVYSSINEAKITNTFLEDVVVE